MCATSTGSPCFTASAQPENGCRRFFPSCDFCVLPSAVFSYSINVRTVTRMSLKAYEEWEVYGEKFKLNKDYLLAGALLHDVGKLIEYEKTADMFLPPFSAAPCH